MIGARGIGIGVGGMLCHTLVMGAALTVSPVAGTPYMPSRVRRTL